MTPAYRVWFVPNPPGPAFLAEVDTLERARFAAELIARYSLYLGEDLIPASAGGIERWDVLSNDWEDAGDEELCEHRDGRLTEEGRIRCEDCGLESAFDGTPLYVPEPASAEQVARARYVNELPQLGIGAAAERLAGGDGFTAGWQASAVYLRVAAVDAQPDTSTTATDAAADTAVPMPDPDEPRIVPATEIAYLRAALRAIASRHTAYIASGRLDRAAAAIAAERMNLVANRALAGTWEEEQGMRTRTVREIAAVIAGQGREAASQDTLLGGDPVLCPRCEGSVGEPHNGYGERCDW